MNHRRKPTESFSRSTGNKLNICDGGSSRLSCKDWVMPNNELLLQELLASHYCQKTTNLRQHHHDIIAVVVTFVVVVKLLPMPRTYPHGLFWSLCLSTSFHVVVYVTSGSWSYQQMEQISSSRSCMTKRLSSCSTPRPAIV